MSNMNKQDILDAIRRTTKENNGVPLGRQRFERETGIKTYEWQKHWPMFGDAQRECGFDPNTFNRAYAEEFLFEKFITLMRELHHYPTYGELRVKRNSDGGFPSPNSMARFGNKQVTAAKILEYSRQKGYLDIIAICEQVVETTEQLKDNAVSRLHQSLGEVYLCRSGRYYKIGKTKDTVRRGSEISPQLPEKLEMIHVIKTDDPNGIEAYWHNRFQSKRKQGEWFDLNSEDVKAFKRWRKIV